MHYVGDIRMFAGNILPAGWERCEGQLLDIDDFETLFFLIGTTYGGDGEFTFALPDLRGRVPIHHLQGPGLTARTLGESGGQPGVVLTGSTIPAHSHSIKVDAAGGVSDRPSGRVLASEPTGEPYGSRRRISGSMSAGAFEETGTGAPHENRPPFLCVNFIIALFGVFPQSS
jgi:microcystin-dependent protein